MTGNASTTVKGKKGSKLPVLMNKDKTVNGIPKNKKMNAKMKKKHDLVQCKTCNIKGKVKRMNIPLKNNLNRLSSNVPVKCNERFYKYQIQQLHMMFNEPLKYRTLTQNELDILSMKYKVDGHYRTNDNLPSFTSLLGGTDNIINGQSSMYDPMEYLMNYNVSAIKSKSNETFDQNQNIEASNIHDPSQPNFLHNLIVNNEILKGPKIAHKMENKYPCQDQGSFTNSSYNHIPMEYNMHADTSMNVLADLQNSVQMKTNLDTMPNTQPQYSSYAAINEQNTMSNEHQMYANSLFNGPNSNMDCENFKSIGAIPQQNDRYNSAEHNALSLNLNYYNDWHLSKWNNNNMTSTSKNTNYQTGKSSQSIYIPEAMNCESHFNSSNAMGTHELTLVGGCLEEEDNFMSFNHANDCSMMNKKILSYTANNANSDTQQDLNGGFMNGVPNNMLSGTNQFSPFSEAILYQYI